MRILGIETSTRTGSVALLDDETIVAETKLVMGKGYSILLMSAIDGLIRGAGLAVQEMEAIAVAIGPGSFTGLRVGVGVGKGLAEGLNKPVVGIPTLEGMAEMVGSDPGMRYCSIAPLLDARRGEAYAAFYRWEGERLKKVKSESVLTVEKFLNGLREKTVFLGDGALLYRKVIEERLGDLALFVPSHFNSPRASTIALLGMRKIREGGAISPEKLVPLYVRRWKGKEKG